MVLFDSNANAARLKTGLQIECNESIDASLDRAALLNGDSFQRRRAKIRGTDDDIS